MIFGVAVSRANSTPNAKTRCGILRGGLRLRTPCRSAGSRNSRRLAEARSVAQGTRGTVPVSESNHERELRPEVLRALSLAAIERQLQPPRFTRRHAEDTLRLQVLERRDRHVRPRGDQAERS